MRLFLTLTIILSTLCTWAQVRFTGATYPPVEITPNASTGLQAVYVLHSTPGVKATYTLPAGTTTVQCSKFGYMGAAYATPLDASVVERSGNDITITQLDGDTGYCISTPSSNYYFWITDYSAHPASITSITPAAEQDCGSMTLNIDGTGERITYYTITGRAMEINREFTITYLSQDAPSAPADGGFVTATHTSTLPYLQPTVHIPSPLCNTTFTLSGDRFLQAWGIEQSASSSTYATHAIAAVTSATQTLRTADNEQKFETALGGSAPVEIAFEAAISDGVYFHEWQMSRDIDFADITYRTSDLSITYTFNEMGTFYVRFLYANSDGSCEDESETYAVTIGESDLKCPNAFTPGSSPGVNDEWRVSYKSIVSFECYIFDRWGTKMAEFHNPAQGWDGRYHGKLVPAGVYYYVIKARGSDGRNYNLSGDINILNSNQ